MILSAATLYGLTGLGLVVIGLVGLVVSAQLLRKILAVNIMASGIFLLLVSLGQPGGEPLPQALVLTGIVVSVSSTAVALALACRVQETANRSGQR